MIVEELDLFTILPDASVRRAMEQINENANGIVVVVDEESRLLGTATDGDIRRAILDGTSLEASVEEVMNPDPFFVSGEVTPRMLRQLSREHGRKQIPIVDGESVVRELFLLDATMPSDDGASDEGAVVGEGVIMAGGLGKRLRPHTEDTPKPMVEVCGKPILEHIIEHLSGEGVERLYITTRYLGEQIENYFGDGSDWGVEIEYVREEKRLGTAGGLTRLQSDLGGATLVMNGDLVTDFNVAEMFRFHRDHDSMITMGVRHYEVEVPYGVAEIEGVEVESLSEKPKFDFFVNAGIYIVQPQVIEHIPTEEYYDITTLVEDILGEEHVVGFPIVEQWLDIGRPEDLRRANEELDLE